jgi:hypothetical protein
MSAVQIQGNASGTGTLTVAAPNTNTNRTLTLPDQTGTLLTGSGAIGVNASTPTSSLNLDSSGNVGIGTSSPSSYGKAGIVTSAGSGSGGPASAIANASLSLGATTTSGALAMGVDATGSYYAWIQATTTANAASYDLALNPIGGSVLTGKTTTSITTVGTVLAAQGRISVTNATTTSADDGIQIYSTGAANYRFWVGMDGTIHAVSTSIAAISDASLKTNVKDLETGLTEVMALKPRRFDWINGDGTNVAGFIAQELEQVLPELVVESKYSQDEQGNQITKKSIKMGDILPTLVKAIQEQQALIIQLQADVAALKGA